MDNFAKLMTGIIVCSITLGLPCAGMLQDYYRHVERMQGCITPDTQAKDGAK